MIKEKWDAVEGSDRLIKSKTKHVNTDRTVIDFSRRFTAASVFVLFLLVLQLSLNIKEHTQTHRHTFFTIRFL